MNPFPRHNWLLECDEKGFRPLRPSDLVYCTEETRRRFQGAFDEFGDCFAEPASLESLKYSMARVREKGAEVEVSRDTMASFESELMEKRPKLGLFRECLFYVDRNGTNGLTDEKD